ncbi:MAG TPA: NRDE family protein [Steroidobacteraceae bacterium]|nr:NRDE family protein [Steroidobacteraceae bacterium]
MCLLVLAWRLHPRYRLVVAANRDEYHERPTSPLGKWPEPNDILAGKDLRAGGTWLGLDRRHRFGAVTNFRELQRPRRSAPSRGTLVPAFLGQESAPEDFLGRLETDAPGYSGFNLLISDTDSLWYASNRADRFARALPPGVYGLSNEYLDTPWPKLRRVRERFEKWLTASSADPVTDLFTLLADREPAADGPPQTGLSPEWERTLSAPFVIHPVYGTRSTTVVLLEPSGDFVIAERRFDPAGTTIGETECHLNAGEWP